MAGLLDLLGFGGSAPSGGVGVLDSGANSGGNGFLDWLGRNSNTLMAFGAGAQNQPSFLSGIGAGASAAMKGAQLDQQDADRRKRLAGENATAAWLKTRNLDPNIASTLAANPELAQQYFVRAITPKSPIKLAQGEELLSGDDPTKVLARGMPKPVATPDDLQGYAMYSQQARASGQNPVDFLTYKQTISKAGATVVNRDQKAESAFATANAQNQAKRYNDLATGYAPATEALSKIQTLRDLSGRLSTGKTAEVQAALGPYAQALGVPGFDNLGDQQAYNSIVSSIIPTLHVAGSGSTSDNDAANFARSLPSLGNAPEGNKTITDTLQSLAEYKQAASDVGSRVVSGELTPAQGEQALRTLPDPYARFKQSLSGAGSTGNVRKTINGKTYERDTATGKIYEVTP